MTISATGASTMRARAAKAPRTARSSCTPCSPAPPAAPAVDSPVCRGVVCCDADHSVLPAPCADDCHDCTLPTPASPCSDIHHISSSCTEPTCGAATSSTSAALCSTAVACCSDAECSEVAVSPCSDDACSVRDCSSSTLAAPTIPACCDDEACESSASPSLKRPSTSCDRLVPPISEVATHTQDHARHPDKECQECRGSIVASGTAEGGRLYGSFQELLDCCCCSMPPTVEQCCVGKTPHPCTNSTSSSADISRLGFHAHPDDAVVHQLAPPSMPSDTPSTSITTHATHSTSPAHGHAHVYSRSSTASSAVTPQPLSASPATAWPWQSEYVQTPSQHDRHKLSGQPFESQAAPSLDDILTELQSWNDCTFEQPHLHTSEGGCLPPAMTLCSSDVCQTAAPHSHWTPHMQRGYGADSDTQHADPRPQLCQWAGCNERFWTVEELVAHVNHSHLAAKNTDAAQAQAKPLLQPVQPHAKQAPLHVGAADGSERPNATVECLWDDCHQVPMPGKLEYGMLPPMAGSELWNGAAPNDKFSLAILQHLLHDHLGQHPAHLAGHAETPALPSKSQKVTGQRSHTGSVLGEGESKTKKRKASESSGTSGDAGPLFCRWAGCSAQFDTHAALTAHIEGAHVGSGKAEYECRWAGCARHASGQKFTQKQKVLRHIQTHTGDRPFKCPECGKRFSEQNTLAQHIRTHTLERPYVCDYPGCGKAFSVAGSLTIHKRTHTGSKPFVCSFPGCDKAFAESSNLTKHMRTHTGVKPFRCEECGKCFSRPDQASRHRKTHERKRNQHADHAHDEVVLA